MERVEGIPEKLLEKLEKDIISYSKECNCSSEDILTALKERQEKKNSTVPVSIFNNTKLSALEAICKYLKENKSLNYRQIAFFLNRNYDPIAITYRNAKRKMPSGFKVSEKPASLDSPYSVEIPLNIFSNEKLSVLENITSYLKDTLKLTLHQIAVMLNRDDRTIWTVYYRAGIKRSADS